jgi:hypothetical protein
LGIPDQKSLAASLYLEEIKNLISSGYVSKAKSVLVPAAPLPELEDDK